jgi:glycosyltransferase involved in cell wall biosynthesis
MKIAYLSASRIPSMTANSVHVMKMSEAMVQAGHEVVLYAVVGDPADDDFNYYGVTRCFRLIRLRRVALRGLGAISYAGGVRRAVRSERGLDLLYSRFVFSLLSCGSAGVPMVYEAHKPPTSFAHRMAEKLLFRHRSFTRLVVISAALAEEYQRLYPELNPDQIRVAHDAANLPEGFPGAAVDASGRVKVGYVGSLYPGRGIEVILSAADQLPDMDFVVVGGSAKEVRRWRGETAAENLSFKGHVRHSQVEEYLNVFDIVLAPYQQKVSIAGGGGDTSRWMSPLKIFEYMAAGKAIICSDLPVLREVLESGRNCILVSPADIDGWVRAILALATDVSLREKLSVNARQELAQKYTWSARAQLVLDGIR